MAMSKLKPGGVMGIITATQNLVEEWERRIAPLDSEWEFNYDYLSVFESENNLIDLTLQLQQELLDFNRYFVESTVGFDLFLYFREGLAAYKASYEKLYLILSVAESALCYDDLHVVSKRQIVLLGPNISLLKQNINSEQLNELNEDFLNAKKRLADVINNVSLFVNAAQDKDLFYLEFDEKEVHQLFFDYYRESADTHKDLNRSLKRNAETFKSNRSEKLSAVHWGSLLDKEIEMYDKLLVMNPWDKPDSTIKANFSESEIRKMIDNPSLISLIKDCFMDDELFDFKRAFSRSLIEKITPENVDIVCLLIHRGNLIRCKVNEDLENEYHRLLTPPQLIRLEDTPLNPNSILAFDEAEKNREAKECVFLAFDAELKEVDDKMLLCLFKVMQDHSVTKKTMSNSKDFANALVEWGLYQPKKDEPKNNAVERLKSSLANKVSELRTLFTLKGRKELPHYKTWESKASEEYTLCEAIAKHFTKKFQYKRVQ